MVKVAEMIEKHLAGILAHGKCGVTHAFLDGLNRVNSEEPGISFETVH